MKLRGWITAAVCAALGALLCVLSLRASYSVAFCRAWERWSPDGGYAQCAVYFSAADGVGADSVLYTVNSCDFGGEYIYCYGGEADAVLSAGRNNTAVKLTLTGGEWFFFVRPRFISGCAYGGEPGRIVLSETAAWKLFGAADVAGLAVTLGGAELVVTGVVDDDGEAEAYVSFDTYHLAGLDVCALYCAVAAPEPHAGAVAAATEPVAALAADTVTANDPERFGAAGLIKNAASLHDRSRRENAVAFPGFENDARAALDLASAGFVISLALFAVSVAIAAANAAVIIKNYRIDKAYRK